MKLVFPFLLALVVSSCHSFISVEEKEHLTEAKQVKTEAQPRVAEPEESISDEMQTCWVLIANKGRDYYSLREQMNQLQNQLGLTIDTLQRTYYPDKDLIALPEDSDDQVYAGEYFPRRDLSESLSLEYLNFYDNEVNAKEIALVAGVFEDSSAAQQKLIKVKEISASAFIIKADIYMGCMH